MEKRILKSIESFQRLYLINENHQKQCIDNISLVKNICMQRLFAPSYYDGEVIINVLKFDMPNTDLFLVNKWFTELSSGKIDASMLFNIVSRMLEEWSKPLYGESYDASHFISKLIEFVNLCDMRHNIRDSTLSRNDDGHVASTAYFISHRSDCISTLSQNDLQLPSHDFSHIYSKVESSLPLSFFIDVDILVHFKLAGTHSINGDFIDKTLSSISNMIEGFNFIPCFSDDDYQHVLDSFEQFMAVEDIYSSTLRLYSISNQKLLSDHRSIQKAISNALVHIASNIYILKLQLIILLSWKCKDAAIKANIQESSMEIMSRILYLSWILLLDMTYPIRHCNNEFSSLTIHGNLESTVRFDSTSNNSLSFEINFDVSIFENFINFLINNANDEFQNIIYHLAPMISSSVFAFLSISGQSATFLKGASMIEPKIGMEASELDPLFTIHSQFNVLYAKVTEIAHRYSVFGETTVNLDDVALRHVEGLSELFDHEIQQLDLDDSHTRSHYLKLTHPPTNADGRLRAFNMLDHWKTSKSNLDLTWRDQQVIRSVFNFLVSSLHGGYMIGSILSSIEADMTFDQLLQSHFIFLFRIYELRVWEMISDLLLKCRTEVPGDMFSKSTICCLQRFDECCINFMEDFPELASYLNGLRLPTTSTIFELAIKSYSFDIARICLCGLIQLNSDEKKLSQNSNYHWKSCVREYIRESARSGMMSDLIDLQFPDESFLQLFLQELEIILSFGTDLNSSIEHSDFEVICSLFLRNTVNYRFPKLCWRLLCGTVHDNDTNNKLENRRLCIASFNTLKTMSEENQFIAIDPCGKIQPGNNQHHHNPGFTSISALQTYIQVKYLSQQCQVDWRNGYALIKCACEAGYVSEALSIVAHLCNMCHNQDIADFSNANQSTVDALLYQAFLQSNDAASYTQLIMSGCIGQSSIDYLSQQNSLYQTSSKNLMIDMFANCDDSMSRIAARLYFGCNVFEFDESPQCCIVAWCLLLLHAKGQTNSNPYNSYALSMLIRLDKQKLVMDLIRYNDKELFAKSYGLSCATLDCYLSDDQHRAWPQVKELVQTLLLKELK